MDGELQQAMQQATTTVTIVMGAVMLVGLALWLMGKKIARQSIALSGLVLGAVAAFPVSQQFGTGAHMTLAWVIAGAVVGCLIAWLLYRVWMAVSMGAILAVALPIIYVVVFGVHAGAQDDEVGGAGTEAVEAAPGDDAPPPASLTDGGSDAGSDAEKSTVDQISDDAADALKLSDEQRALLDKARKTLFEQIRAHYIRIEASTRAWWDGLADASKHNVKAAFAIGAILGVLLGLFMPNVSASFETALIGTCFVFIGIWGILVAEGKDPHESLPFPPTPINIIFALSLITHLGIAVQWTLWRQKTDK